MSDRSERIQEALRAAAAEFIAREATPQSLITVTRAEVSENGHRGTIYLTTLPESAEKAAVDFANRHRADFASFFEKKVRGARAPQIEFVIDLGEKHRRRLDELSS